MGKAFWWKGLLIKTAHLELEGIVDRVDRCDQSIQHDVCVTLACQALTRCFRRTLITFVCAPFRKKHSEVTTVLFTQNKMLLAHLGYVAS